MRENDKSFAAFRKALDLNPSYVAAHYNLGTLLLRIGRYGEALLSLREAIRLNPKFADAYYNLAAAHAQLGDKGEAIRELRKAIELNSTLASEARKDEDFNSLRSDPDFITLTR